MLRAHSFRPLPLVVALQALFAVPAFAQFTVTTGSTDTAPKTLNGQAGVVQSGGSLTISNAAVGVTVGAGIASITNSGSISQTGTGRAINNGSGAATLTISNTAGASISAAATDAIKIDVVGSRLTLSNEGTIAVTTSAFDGGQAIDMKKLFTGSSTISNGSAAGSAALIQSNSSDGIRIGARTTLVNYGSIIGNGKTNTSSGSADGVDDDDAAHVGIVIQNYGLISGARHGVTLKSTSTAALSQTVVSNFAGGRMIGHNGSGVGSDGAGIVTNYGLISGRYAGAGNIFTNSGVASLNGDGDGVDIDGTGTVNNYGRIEGLDGGGVDSGGRPNGGDGVAMGGGVVTNFAGGMIWGKSNGILVDDGAAGTDAANLAANKNRGTSVAAASAVSIVNSGAITGDRKAGIGLVGDWADTVTNHAAGVITGGVDAQQVDMLATNPAQRPGAALQMGAGNDSLTNYGRIEGKNGLAIDMGLGDDATKLLGGMVIGTIDGGAGVDTLETGGAQSFNLGTVVNFERFIVRSGSTAFNYGLGHVSSVQIDAGASLQVNGALATTGNLVLDGAFKAAAAPDVRNITVGGNLTVGATGVLQAGVGGTSAADKIVVAGTANLANGASIEPIARSFVTNGARYTLVSAAGGLTVAPGSLRLINSSALVNYSLSVSGNDLVLTAQRQASLGSLAPGGLASMGAALEALTLLPGAAASPVLTALDNLPNAQAVTDALRQLAPSSGNAAGQASNLATSNLFSAFDSRTGAARSGLQARSAAMTGLAGGDTAGRRTWVQGLGAWGNQSERAGADGYKLQAYGLAAGLEVDRNATDVMGLSLALTQAGADGTGAGQGDNLRAGAVNLGGYFSQNRADLTVDASAILSQSSYKTQRTVVFPGVLETLTGSYKGWQLAGRIELGLPFAAGGDWSGRWLAGARAGLLTTQGYTEQGSAALAQQVGSSCAKSLQSVLGAELTQNLSASSSLQLRGRYLREFAGAPGTTAAFVAGGPSFTAANAPNRNTLQLGIGYRHMTQQGVRVTVGYDVEAKEKVLSHQLSARASWAF